MPKALELTNQKFNRLRVITRVPNSEAGQSKWLCECDCGRLVKVMGTHLKSGHSQSCGCLIREATIKRSLKHGCTTKDMMTRTYKVWMRMSRRCNNPNHSTYKWYGGRGIKVCKRWENFENFLSDMGEVPKGLSIDRIDNDGDYEPGNCRWATHLEQMRNNSWVKLNPLKVKVIKKLLKESQLKQWEIAEIFHVKRVTISAICSGRNWADIQC